MPSQRSESLQDASIPVRMSFEPIIDFQSGRSVGSEALFRMGNSEKSAPTALPLWMHNETFRETLLSFGLSTAITYLSRKNDAGYFASINADPAEIANPKIVDTIVQHVADANLDPACLKIEISESPHQIAPGDLRRGVEQLNSQGINAFLDNFGSGHQPYTYLIEMPVAGIKLNREVIKGARDDPRRSAILESFARLSDSLDILAIIEGIETVEEEEFARQTGNRYGQGYLYEKKNQGNASEQ